MDFTTYLWSTAGAFLTLATFSFLYKDNPFYKIAEHLVVGVSAGYFMIILWHNGLVPNLFNRLADGTWYFVWLDSARWWYLLPALLGVMMWTRFHKKYSWISRWPMGLYIGISTGIAIPLEMSNRVSKQLYATMVINSNDPGFDWANVFGHGGFNLLDNFSGLSQIIIAVGALSALVYFFTAADDVQVVELVPTAEGLAKVQEAPAELPSRAATFLQIRGNLFYAAVDRIEALLPSARQADYPAVILSLLGQEQINSTFINLLERYDEQLKASRGKLMLAGVSQHAKEQLDRTETTDELLGEENIFEATEILGESGQAAYQAAQAWLEGLEPEHNGDSSDTGSLEGGAAAEHGSA